MPLSIGLIESKGLVALIEAADVILKNSPVKILGIHTLNNGLVSLAVSGNSDYIEAAIESAVSAGEKVGEIFSHSIVHNPKKELIEFFSELYPQNKLKIESIETNRIGAETAFNEKKLNSNEPIIIPLAKKKIRSEQATLEKQTIKKEKIKLKKHQEVPVNIVSEIGKSSHPSFIEKKNEQSLSTIERLRKEALGIKKVNLDKNDNEEAAVVTNSEKQIITDRVDFDLINTLNVHKLRNYARRFIQFPIKGREISRASRLELVEYFKKLNQ